MLLPRLFGRTRPETLPIHQRARQGPRSLYNWSQPASWCCDRPSAPRCWRHCHTHSKDGQSVGACPRRCHHPHCSIPRKVQKESIPPLCNARKQGRRLLSRQASVHSGCSSRPGRGPLVVSLDRSHHLRPKAPLSPRQGASVGGCLQEQRRMYGEPQVPPRHVLGSDGCRAHVGREAVV